MKKEQFNTRVTKDIKKQIKANAKVLGKKHGINFSQADYITWLVASDTSKQLVSNDRVK